MAKKKTSKKHSFKKVGGKKSRGLDMDDNGTAEHGKEFSERAGEGKMPGRQVGVRKGKKTAKRKGTRKVHR